MRLPKNLITVVDELNTDNLFSELFILDYENKDLSKVSFDSLTIKAVSKVDFSIYEFFQPISAKDLVVDNVKTLADDVFEKIIGLRSCSDILDYASHEDFSSYSTKYKEKNDPNEVRNDYFDEVKQNVLKKISNTFASTDNVKLQDFKSFKNLIKSLHCVGKSHLTDPNYLEYIIINSRIFQNYVVQSGSSYGG